jgi:hypothetical protein
MKSQEGRCTLKKHLISLSLPEVIVPGDEKLYDSALNYFKSRVVISDDFRLAKAAEITELKQALNRFEIIGYQMQK